MSVLLHVANMSETRNKSLHMIIIMQSYLSVDVDFGVGSTLPGDNDLQTISL